MAPTDRFKLPLRWQFIPVEQPTDGSIRWKWHAYTHAGNLALQSDKEYESLTECIDAAKHAGYTR